MAVSASIPSSCFKRNCHPPKDRTTVPTASMWCILPIVVVLSGRSKEATKKSKGGKRSSGSAHHEDGHK